MNSYSGILTTHNVSAHMDASLSMSIKIINWSATKSIAKWCNIYKFATKIKKQNRQPRIRGYCDADADDDDVDAVVNSASSSAAAAGYQKEENEEEEIVKKEEEDEEEKENGEGGVYEKRITG